MIADKWPWLEDFLKILGVNILADYHRSWHLGNAKSARWCPPSCKLAHKS